MPARPPAHIGQNKLTSGIRKNIYATKLEERIILKQAAEIMICSHKKILNSHAKYLKSKLYSLQVFQGYVMDRRIGFKKKGQEAELQRRRHRR
jgi:hypothetical protein